MRYFLTPDRAFEPAALPLPECPTMIFDREELNALLKKEKRLAKQRKTTTRLPVVRA